MGQSTKLIVFKLKTEQYGAELQQVRSIERIQEITPVPQAPSFLKGVMKLREEIIPVLDLKDKLLGERLEKQEESRILIIQSETGQVGLMVDAATDVIDIEADTIHPAPAALGEMAGKYIKGVAQVHGKLLILLHLKQILNAEEISALKAAVAEDNAK